MKGVTCVCACAVLTLVLGSLSAPTPALAQFGGDREAETDSPFAFSEHKAKPAAAKPTCLCVGQGDASRIERIKQVLRSPLHGTGLQFTDVPLEQVVVSLRDQYDIPIQIDVRALDDIGLSPDELVTVDLQHISLQSALRLMLGTLQLTYVIRDEVLLITTPEVAESCLVTCVYDVRDLIVGQGEDQGMKAISAAIVSCVAPHSWSAKRDGGANIRPLRPGILVVLQTPEIHEQIGQLLASIRQLRGMAQVGSAPSLSQGHAGQFGGRGGGFSVGERGFRGGYAEGPISENNVADQPGDANEPYGDLFRP